MGYSWSMDSEQAYELETLQRVTQSSDGDLLRLARECAHDDTLVHLGQLTRVDAGEMIQVLREYRYFKAVGALDLVRELV